MPSQAAGERSYHVFYQLTQSPKYSASLQLLDAPSYRFLAGGGCYEVAGINDEDDFAQLLASFSGLGFSDAEVDGVMALVGGILSVGNLDFARDGEGCQVAPKSAEMLAAVARLWSARRRRCGAPTIRTIEVRGSTTEIPPRPTEAPAVCAAFGKSVYNTLFNFPVGRSTARWRGAAAASSASSTSSASRSSR